MLFIRTDMNDSIAMGHLMRCISIADAARRLGIETTFITSDHNSDKILKSYGLDFIVLETDYIDLMQGIESISSLVTKDDVLLIDTYSETADFMNTLRGRVTTAYIDDLGEQIYNVDYLICYAVYYHVFNYYERYKNNNNEIKFLLGTKYAPLRNEFVNTPEKQIRDNIDNILIISGGSDPYKIIPKILERLVCLNNKNMKITAICGFYNDYFDILSQKYGTNDSRVSILPYSPHIKEEFDRADVVISAAGTSLYESCATGTPTISYTCAQNQMNNAIEFDRMHLIPYLGDIAEPNNIVDNCIIELKRMNNRNCREKISSNMRKLINGCGAYCIVNELFDNKIDLEKKF